MPQQWMSAVRTSLMLRAVIAAAAGGVLLVGVNVALSNTCIGGLGACETPVRASGEILVADLVAEPEPAPVALTADPSVPTLSRNDVLAKTFATLNIELTAPQAIDVGRPSTQAVDEDADANQTELTKRVVRTVAIRADGTPELGQPAVPDAASVVAVAETENLPSIAPLKPQAAAGLEVASAAPQPAVAAINAASAEPVAETAVASLTPGEGQPFAIAGADAFANSSSALEAEEAIAPAPQKRPTDALAYAPSGGKTSVQVTETADGKTATVGGQGVNVRSAPSKSKSKVLFSLAGGTEVTITDSSKGWQYVTDSKGRSGWAYKDLLVMD